MTPISVFASTRSRLHADLVVIRLRRAGVPRDKISAVFPESLKPNLALCWLDRNSKPTLYNGETVIAGGPIVDQMSTQSEPSFIHGLQQMGLNLNDACSYAERLHQGQILVSISTNDSSDVALAWQTFRELEAEGVALGLAGGPTQGEYSSAVSATVGRDRDHASKGRRTDRVSLGIAV